MDPNLLKRVLGVPFNCSCVSNMILDKTANEFWNFVFQNHQKRNPTYTAWNTAAN